MASDHVKQPFNALLHVGDIAYASTAVATPLAVAVSEKENKAAVYFMCLFLFLFLFVFFFVCFFICLLFFLFFLFFSVCFVFS